MQSARHPFLQIGETTTISTLLWDVDVQSLSAGPSEEQF